MEHAKIDFLLKIPHLISSKNLAKKAILVKRYA